MKAAIESLHADVPVFVRSSLIFDVVLRVEGLRLDARIAELVEQGSVSL